jgi:hypothetical protein
LSKDTMIIKKRRTTYDWMKRMIVFLANYTNIIMICTVFWHNHALPILQLQHDLNSDHHHLPRAYRNSVLNLGPVCLLESSFFFGKWIPGKWIPGNYFPIFGSVMKNKLENIFQCLVMSWKMSWKITYLCFIFLKFIKIMRNKSYKLKSWMRMKLKKKYNFISYLK